MPYHVARTEEIDRGLAEQDFQHAIETIGPKQWDEHFAKQVARRARRREANCLNLRNQGGTVLVYFGASFWFEGTIYTIAGWCRAASPRAFERELLRRGYLEPLVTRSPDWRRCFEE